MVCRQLRLSLLLVARLFKRTFKLLSYKLAHVLPHRTAQVLGIVSAVALFWLIIEGVIFSYALQVADRSYQQVDELIAFFLALTGGTGGQAEFRRRFDLMALQRNLKALGTFGYMTTSRNNTVYIQYIPRTVAYVKANLAKYPRFERLRQLIEPWL